MRSGWARRYAGPIVALVAVVVLALAFAWRTWPQSSVLDEGGEASAPASADEPSIEQLRAAAEASSGDAVAWQRLGFEYFARNMFAEAAEAYEKAAGIEPDSAILWSSLGEARVMASEVDPMPQAALQAFRRAVGIDPGDPRARYFLAVAKDLEGDHEAAIGDWLALLADTPPGAAWEADLVRTIEQVGRINTIDVSERLARASATRDILPVDAAGGIPGPSQEQMAAAASLSPAQQQGMAEEMVARLAARLETEPDDVGGWIMLMRSYTTLERRADAQAAYRSALVANPESRPALQEAARTLGL